MLNTQKTGGIIKIFYSQLLNNLRAAKR